MQVEFTHHGLQSSGCETSLQIEWTEIGKKAPGNDAASFQVWESPRNRSSKCSSVLQYFTLLKELSMAWDIYAIDDLSLTLGLTEQNG